GAQLPVRVPIFPKTILLIRFDVAEHITRFRSGEPGPRAVLQARCIEARYIHFSRGEPGCERTVQFAFLPFLGPLRHTGGVPILPCAVLYTTKPIALGLQVPGGPVFPLFTA